MIYLICNLAFPLSNGEPDFTLMAARELRCKRTDLQNVQVYKKSIDARRKDQIKIIYSLAAEVPDGLRIPNSPYIRPLHEETPDFTCGEQKMQTPPVIVGFGPAGFFCALALARAGFRPIVLEQGSAMEKRVGDVDAFCTRQELNSHSNIQFGEGGAGTFSDGKLTTRINDPYCHYILRELVNKGAPSEILTSAKPHIGTDLLRKVVVEIRKEILSLGGEIHFDTQVTDLVIKNGKIDGVMTERDEIKCEALILATGNASRDLFECCLRQGIGIVAKPFSVGVRIEHLQDKIDEALYGKFAGHPMLSHGEYQLSQRDASTGRAVYTFCMCPGGVVVPAASERESIVTNGMSFHARDGRNANSALVVSVDSRDFGNHPLDGVRFQRELEQKAYRMSGSYRAPIQSVGSFMDGKCDSGFAGIKPTYAIGTEFLDLHNLFPSFVSDKLAEGLMVFGRRISGFNAPEALMTAPETRTSSPVRILRGEDDQSTSVRGIYPCGEGSGYAGGIMSSAVDGIRTAQSITARYAPID